MVVAWSKQRHQHRNLSLDDPAEKLDIIDAGAAA